jgi:hypothetical protein
MIGDAFAADSLTAARTVTAITMVQIRVFLTLHPRAPKIY